MTLAALITACFVLGALYERWCQRRALDLLKSLRQGAPAGLYFWESDLLARLHHRGYVYIDEAHDYTRYTLTWKGGTLADALLSIDANALRTPGGPYRGQG